MNKKDILNILDITSFISISIATVLVLIFEYAGYISVVTYAIIMYSVSFLILTIFYALKVYCAYKGITIENEKEEYTKKQKTILIIKTIFSLIIFVFALSILILY